MENKDIFSHIDHTLLRPTATNAEIDKLCAEASENGTASVCVAPHYVKYVRDKYPEMNICTVIGFPLGYSTWTVKCYETQDAIANGADEIDMVINLCNVKNGDLDLVEKEIMAVRSFCEGKILKVIIETCLLTKEEKIIHFLLGILIQSIFSSYPQISLFIQ